MQLSTLRSFTHKKCVFIPACILKRRLHLDMDRRLLQAECYREIKNDNLHEQI